MIDRRTIKFFQELPKLEQSNNNFFEEDFDIPTIMRDKKYQPDEKKVMGSDTSTVDAAYLDIPAFLRRQAD